MSRWTKTRENAYKYSTYISPKLLLFQVSTAQGTFTFESAGKIDYRKTREKLEKKGFTDVNICYIGRV